MCVYECVYADLLFASLNPFNVNYINHFRKKKTPWQIPTGRLFLNISQTIFLYAVVLLIIYLEVIQLCCYSHILNFKRCIVNIKKHYPLVHTVFNFLTLLCFRKQQLVSSTSHPWDRPTTTQRGNKREESLQWPLIAGSFSLNFIQKKNPGKGPRLQLIYLVVNV